MQSLQREHLRTLREPASSQYSKLMPAEVHYFRKTDLNCQQNFFL